MGDYLAETFVNNTDPPINDTRMNNLSRGLQSAHSEINRLPAKLPVRCASIANIPSLSGSLNIDGIVTTTGDRVLVKDQTTLSQNGIYTANDNGAWARSEDANTTEKWHPYFSVFVATGYFNYRTDWLFVNQDAVTLGTSSLRFFRRLPQQAPVVFTLNTLGTINTTGTTESRPTGMPVPGDTAGSIFEVGVYNAAINSTGQSGQSRARFAWNFLEYGQFKIITNVLVAGTVNAVIRLQYLQDAGTWQNLTDNTGLGNVSISSVGTKDSGFMFVRNAASDIRIDKLRFLRLVVEGNTNTSLTNAMTQLGNTYAIFRT